MNNTALAQQSNISNYFSAIAFTENSHIDRAIERIKKTYEKMDGKLALTSSFGPYSLVMVDLVRRAGLKDIPVVAIDIPDEKYDLQRLYRNYLHKDLGLNLEILPAPDDSRKKETLRNGLHELGIEATIDGIRQGQTENRLNKGLVEYDPFYDGVIKIHPLIDWTQEQVQDYIESLPRVLHHPAYAPGVQAVGGAILNPGEVKIECGLHVQ